jgi:uncharacterized protein (TIGR03437 family)
VDTGFPAVAGETIVLYLTGLSAVSVDQQDGVPAPSSPLVTTVVMPQVSLSNVSLGIVFSGLTQGLIGIEQVNVMLPSLLPGSGSAPLSISGGGVTASAQISLQQ